MQFVFLDKSDSTNPSDALCYPVFTKTFYVKTNIPSLNKIYIKRKYIFV